MDNIKKCNTCNEIKAVSEFNKKNNGLSSMCKECNKEWLRNYRRTKDGLLKNIYNNQKRASKKRGMSNPTYTFEELKEYAYSKDIFFRLYDEWVESGFKKSKVPSFDRLDNTVGYTLSNIQIVTWETNERNYKDDRVNGKVKDSNKAVCQYDLDGNFIAEYHSIEEADRKTKSNQSVIVKCCKGKVKTSQGFIWKYKESEVA